MVDLVEHQDARYKAINKLHIGVNYSCNLLHATREMNNAQYVDWKNISKNHRAFFVYRMFLWGEWWVEIALIAQAAILQIKKKQGH